ncbi:hypothetical protein [Qipengyuania sp. SM2507]
MRSLYVLSSLRSWPVGNQEMRFGPIDQAKTDIGKASDRYLRGLTAWQRQLSPVLRGACWITRRGDRYLRESPEDSDSQLPLCSSIVLFVFLQVSFRDSR